MPPSVLPPQAKARAAAEIDAEAERLFGRIDFNKNGVIDANELLKHLLEAGVDTDEITRTFAAIDTDGDGMITKEEWRAGYARYLAADETSRRPSSRRSTSRITARAPKGGKRCGTPGPG